MAIDHQRRVWSKRAQTWAHEGAPHLERVVAAVLTDARTRGDETAVDLGCGSGQLTIPLARRVATVLAVDVAPAMIAQLRANAAAASVDNVDARSVPIEELRLEPASVDLVVSNYALHHLRDADKARVMAAAANWLRPGGRIVIGDMMLGRGGSARDRAIIAAKVKSLVRQGPGGVWRLVKNALRFALRVQERPLSMASWETLLTDLGFEQVAGRTVLEEAAVVRGRRPESPAPTHRPAEM